METATQDHQLIIEALEYRKQQLQDAPDNPPFRDIRVKEIERLTVVIERQKREQKLIEQVHQVAIRLMQMTKI